jgi:hypothetical protein
LDNHKPDDKIKLFVLRGQERKPLIMDVALVSFELNTFSGAETEKKKYMTIKDPIPLYVPLLSKDFSSPSQHRYMVVPTVGTPFFFTCPPGWFQWYPLLLYLPSTLYLK